MRKMDIERLAASYGLTIDYLGALMYVELLSNWKLAWGPDGRWDLLPAPNAMINLGTFVPDELSFKVDKHSNPKGCFKIVNHRVVNFVRNSTYDISILEIRNLDELKQFFDDFYAKWAERRKIHKIQEISSIAGDYTV